MKRSKKWKIISSIAVFGSLGRWVLTLKIIQIVFHWTIFLTYTILSGWIIMGSYMFLFKRIVLKLEIMEKEEEIHEQG